MSTQLGSYCQQFDTTLRPLLQQLGSTVAAIDGGAPQNGRSALRGSLADLHHHLGVLCDKVKGQQAFVLIFGPLKSGKSTLMNALAAAYVSEVSSLPAYPCLVFVGAGPKREFAVTRYDGRSQAFADGAQLHGHIHQAHDQLALAIRTAEQRGQTFDPQEHFPGAIRRVDVKVPAPAAKATTTTPSVLAGSGAVLVDTPGLYTRMRFGYDRMTRDFRDAAACAIFVVKSDTLFLEQVFAEFHQLLDLFSRIFLVVNVDAHKRDVSPDGKLVPSLEQSDPDAVLHAFERLAMSAPLQAAAAAGKVKLYPVDLLHAASSVLQQQPEEQHPAGFRRFRHDLETYLASTDYLAAFLRDSLQRGQTLLAEIRSACDSEPVRDLVARTRALAEQLAFLQSERQRVEQALGYDWSNAFARFQRQLDEELERVARDAGQKLLRTLGASIDTWFLSSQSLHWLVHQQWTPLLQDYRELVAAAALRCFEQAQGQPDLGLDLPDGLPELLRRLGIDLRALRSQALRELGAVRWQEPAAIAIDTAAIPIRKGLLDRVAFRSLDQVRQRLFGDPRQPDHKIPGKEKAARLGEPGRLHLHQRVATYRAELAPRTVAAIAQHFATRLTQASVDALTKQLRQRLPELEQQHAEAGGELTRLRSMLLPLQQTAAMAQELEPKLTALGTQFGRDFAVAAQAKATADVVLQPQPRRDGKGSTVGQPRPGTTPVPEPRR